DLNGVGDAMQIVKKDNFVYVAHVGYNDLALSILDVADPENPKLVRQIPKSKNAHSHKVQIVGNILIQNSEYIPYVKRADSHPPETGVIVYNLDDPTDPKKIAFYDVPGGRGVHRMWFRDLPYAHLSAQVRGAKQQGYQIVDLSDPYHPTMAGAWWVPGTFPDDPDPWGMIDIREERNPVMISSFPRPKPLKKWGVDSFFDLGGRFGPHNIHENYAGSLISENLIFSTWFNGGMLIHDISDPNRPEEVGFFRPPAPEGQDGIQLNDLYIDSDRLCYVGDRIHGGLYIAEYTGPVM